MASALEEIRFPSQGRELYGRLRSHADDAPTVVLLCGLGFHTFEYEPLAVLLADKGTNCLSFDYRGHGRSRGARGVWTLEDLVTDTRCGIALVRKGFRGPVYLFGNSLGGMVGILAGAMDSSVAGMVACNCPAHLADFMLPRFRRLLFSTMKIVGSLVSFRVSVKHFYSYGQLIRDEFWVKTFESDPLIAGRHDCNSARHGTTLASTRLRASAKLRVSFTSRVAMRWRSSTCSISLSLAGRRNRLN